MVEAVIPPDRQSTSLENEITAIFKDIPKDRMILRLGTELTASYNLDAVLIGIIRRGLHRNGSAESGKQRN